MIQEDYHITLEAFKGPLDLLLYLIRRAEVDISDIPIARITDQYISFLRGIEAIDIDTAGEFLVMAATLVEIKSRYLAALRARKQAAGAGEGEEGPLEFNLEDADPRHELVQQLLAYQRFRDAAEELDARREAFENRFPARPGRRGQSPEEAQAAAAAAAEELQLELEDAHIFDLFDAYERIIESVDFSRLGEHQVEDADTPIGLHQEDLLDRLRRAGDRRITLQEAWTGRTRSEVIGLFLATLELVRQRRVIVVQDALHGEIMLELNDDPDVAVADEDVEAAADDEIDQG